MIDVLFIIPNSSKKIYQNLANNFSAIEPPTWALLLASSMIKNNFSCEIMLRLCLMHSDWLQILRSQSDRLKQTLRKFTLQFSL